MTLAIDLESIKRLTNLADVNRALLETHARERSIEAELEELLSRRSAIQETFVTLHDSASEVRTLTGLCPIRSMTLFAWEQNLDCKMVPSPWATACSKIPPCDADHEFTADCPAGLRDSYSGCKCSIAQALEGLLADAEQLAGSVHSTAELSERVSKVFCYFTALSLPLMYHWPGRQGAFCAIYVETCSAMSSVSSLPSLLAPCQAAARLSSCMAKP